MNIKELLKKELNKYSKDELIEALLTSSAATSHVIEKCKALYGSAPKQDKKPASKKEAPANGNESKDH